MPPVGIARQIVYFELAVSIALALLVGWNHYRVHTLVDSWAEKARLSDSAADTAECMTQYQVGLERLGLTKGHFRLTKNGPSDDLEAFYRSVVDLNSRLAGYRRKHEQLGTPGPEYQQIREDLKFIPERLTGAVLLFNYGLYLVGLGALIVLLSLYGLLATSPAPRERLILVAACAGWVALMIKWLV